MFLIHAHVLPTENAHQDESIKGAYAVLYINYADIDGAYELARYYLENEGWEIDELEEEYFILESPESVEKEQQQYYDEALEYGYSIIFHCYESDDDD